MLTGATRAATATDPTSAIHHQRSQLGQPQCHGDGCALLTLTTVPRITSAHAIFTLFRLPLRILAFSAITTVGAFCHDSHALADFSPGCIQLHLLQPVRNHQHSAVFQNQFVVGNHRLSIR
ncbi:hypothetical protein Kalk_09490 [Ketobacter alkanivorans]|uniref:Uncharacterized protein n=1 Tax=Ketobacter alkanivorans TaxID=1917421 RepID=A0A2K9LK26_9GAMM|nr:hypothetical protein Kalk_09490 [Ketobacter alkanivorans]